jgi:hypothetical protein
MPLDQARPRVVIADPTARAEAQKLLHGANAMIVDSRELGSRSPHQPAGGTPSPIGFWIGGNAAVEAETLYHLGAIAVSTRPLVIGIDPASALLPWLADELNRRHPGLPIHRAIADLATAVRHFLMRQEQGMQTPLVTGAVREELVGVLTRLGGLKEIASAFAERGLPDPVPEDGRVNRSPKAKLISRYFDSIDWTDATQAEQVFALCTKALRAMRNEHRHYDVNFTASLQFLNVKNALASDGYGIDEQLRIVALTGPAPLDEPIVRYPDPGEAFDAAINEAISAAQTVRALLGRSRPILSVSGDARSQQLLEATAALLDQPACKDVEQPAREAFEHLTVAASALFALTRRPYNQMPTSSQTTAWMAQITLRAWSQAALELLEVARSHRPADAAAR